MQAPKATRVKKWYWPPRLPTLSRYGCRAARYRSKAQEVRRIREEFLDFQYRNEVKTLGRWQVRQNILEKLEAIFNEPSDEGMGAVLGRFFDAWQNVARYPESEGGPICIAPRRHNIS